MKSTVIGVCNGQPRHSSKEVPLHTNSSIHHLTSFIPAIPSCQFQQNPENLPPNLAIPTNLSPIPDITNYSNSTIHLPPISLNFTALLDHKKKERPQCSIKLLSMKQPSQFQEVVDHHPKHRRHPATFIELRMIYTTHIYPVAWSDRAHDVR